MEQIILYTIHCRLCDKLKQELDKHNKVYQIIDDKNIMEKLKFNNMPVLYVNGNYLNFQEAIMWLRSADNNGN